MALPASGNPIGFQQISDEFGDNDSSSLGGYRLRSGGATFPQSFPGGLSFSALDTGIPTGTSDTDTIRFSDFYSKKLNIVVDFYSGGTVYRQNALTKYNGNSVSVIGGYAGKPTNPGGKKVYIHVNKFIGSDQNINHRNVALTTGSFDSATELFVSVGTSGAIMGAGGKGGLGKKDAKGVDGVDGSSALGLLHTATIINNGIIRTGFGGGGGGSGNGQNVKTGKKSSAYETGSGGGGGGGAGLPRGLKGDAEQGATSNGSAGGDGDAADGGDGGAGGTGAGAGGNGGGTNVSGQDSADRAPSGGTSSKFSTASLGGRNGYAIIFTGGSAPTITGNAVVGRILTSATPT
tara:strand:+ start:1627 stop:2670 length:1044 start_codon:yes stop_codon:yes gene_type:complete